MATDSTELTFVRCPSCRSLVPAVSTRCRMCGATLDANAKADTPPESADNQSRRVRQRTSSQPDDNMTVAVTAARAEPPAPPAAPPAAPPVAAEAMSDEPAEEFDPLKDYLGEPVEPAPAGNGSSAAVKPAGDDFDPFAADDDEFDLFEEDEADDAWSMSEEPKKDPVPAQAFGAPTPEHEVLQNQPPASPKQFVPPAQPQQAAPQSAPSQAALPGESPRVVVESGARPFGKPSSLSFGKEREQERPRTDEKRAAPAGDRRDERGARQERAPEPPRRDTQDRKPERDDRRGGADQRQQQSKPQQHQQNQQPAKGRDGGPRDGGRREEPRPAPQEKQRQPQQPQRPNQQRDERLSTGGQGALCGWLVSYESPEGRPIELREGKCFVTGSSLKTNDLVIAHGSVSTPHAMMTISLEDGFSVQDLMSEGGVHIRRPGQSSYETIGSTAEVESHDWVKFGEVEYLVVLIPIAAVRGR